MEIKIRIVQDKRRKLQNGKYPIKIRAYNSGTKKEKRITTGLEMFEKDFNTCWKNGKREDQLKGNDKINFQKLYVLHARAEEAVSSLDYFDFKEFENRLRRKSSDKTNVSYHFSNTIKRFKEKGRIGAASSYNSALISLTKFHRVRTKSNNSQLSFLEINPKWLEDYEDYMVDDQERSITTVAIYTRTLRVIFNNAISSKDLDKKYYPFGRGKYEIPEERKVKKSLSQSQVGQMYNAKLPPLQDRARNYWFFSYSTNGMNFKDMAMLKFANLNQDEVSYYREKTKVKKRSNKKKIVVKLNSISTKIIDLYRNEQEDSDNYIFPILEKGDKPEIIFRKVNNFIRSINQQLKHIAKDLDFPDGFSTYWARHSFATNMINIGASIEMISEALNHSDTKVTQHYFDGFEEATKSEMMEKLIGNL